MPWGQLSIVQMDPRVSNDGPILWIRPGEQLVPTAELTNKTPLKRQRYVRKCINMFVAIDKFYYFLGLELMSFVICNIYPDYLKHVKLCLKTEQRLMLIMSDMDMIE